MKNREVDPKVISMNSESPLEYTLTGIRCLMIDLLNHLSLLDTDFMAHCNTPYLRVATTITGLDSSVNVAATFFIFSDELFFENSIKLAASII